MPFREYFDEVFGTEPPPADQTNTLPIATEAFKEAARFVKIFDLKKDKKRFEIFTRYLLSYVAC